MNKLSYSKNSILHVYDAVSQQTTAFDTTPLMRASAWHADGVRLAYGINVVYMLNTESGAVEVISAEGVTASYPAWHPDGETLCYDTKGKAGYHLVLHHLDTGNLTYVSVGMQALQTTFDPTGQWLAFVGVVDSVKQIYRLNLDCIDTPDVCADAVEQLTNEVRFNHAPAWSPDGALIAFERYLEDAKEWAIMLMDADGSNLRQLTAPTLNAHHPSWSADGQYIAFESETRLGSDLCIIKQDGTDLKVIKTDAGLEPDWYQPR